jgi:uncharacterized protein YutE (UPF0331/DUF86 family)
VKIKLGKLETYIQGLEDKRGASLETFRLDRDLQDIVERRFVKAIQASIDVASHFVASIPSREPGTYRDLFTVFAEEEILDADLAERMGEMAGFRSVLAHDYADIDHDRVHEHLEHLDRFREFAAAIHAHVDD